jgi:ribonucleotide monophosphatase NagD (HAD superfamily)
MGPSLATPTTLYDAYIFDLEGTVYLAEAILGLLDLPPDRCLMTGDRLETDVQMGLAAGMSAALALTGATSKADLAASEIKPTYVVGRLADLLPGS